MYLLVFSFVMGSGAEREEGTWKERNEEVKIQVITYPIQNIME